jgi:hypothetical protein
MGRDTQVVVSREANCCNIALLMPGIRPSPPIRSTRLLLMTARFRDGFRQQSPERRFSEDRTVAAASPAARIPPQSVRSRP